MVIIKFRTAEEAKDFAQEYNGRPFNAMEVCTYPVISIRITYAVKPEICHVVNVLSVEIETNDATSLAISRLATAQGNMHELPTCPVCLERMDAAVTGLVTVPCSHTFHCMCLSKWGDSRYVCAHLCIPTTHRMQRKSGVLCADTHKPCFPPIPPPQMHGGTPLLKLLAHLCPSALIVRRQPTCGSASYAETSVVDATVVRTHTPIMS